MDEMARRQDGPEYPMPPGGRVPDLNLAGESGWNVASGSSIVQPMPEVAKPLPMEYSLHGSPEMGGVDPDNIIPSLNLAGVEGVPPPEVVARGMGDLAVHGPDFGVPDMRVPALKGFDLTGPGLTYMPEWSADPVNPDLSEYHRPYGLDIQGNDVLTVDPQTADLLSYDTPSGLAVNHSPLLPDPLVPDLQNPDLTQQVHMTSRPGDLDRSALDVMDGTPGHALVADKDYPAVMMDQSGMNNTRSRRMTLLMDGLHAEERR
ncbi:MAG: hypothetical protein JO202_00335 [Ktedonobacteraceae bacterium]|nr:hypothetical protein [Ktedonobacteraceae bacterium]